MHKPYLWAIKHDKLRLYITRILLSFNPSRGNCLLSIVIKTDKYDSRVVYPIGQSTISHPSDIELYPFTRTKRVICSPELLARRKVLTTSLNASTQTPSIPSSKHHGNILEVVYIILPTMFGLRLVCKTERIDGLDFGSGICHI